MPFVQIQLITTETVRYRSLRKSLPTGLTRSQGKATLHSISMRAPTRGYETAHASATHWLTTGELKRRSVALACRRFKGTHSFDRIAEMINEISSEYGINKRQLIATVTDNGSNFVKAFEAFGIKKDVIAYENQRENSVEKDIEEQEEDTDSEDDDEEETVISSADWTITLPNHIRCSSHTQPLCFS